MDVIKFQLGTTNNMFNNANLLEQLGIDPRDFEWQDLAACKEYPVNLFFDEYEKSSVVAENVDQICLNCPVAKECYNRGVETGSAGVWGGFYLVNGLVSKKKNSHKTTTIALGLAEKVFEDG